MNSAFTNPITPRVVDVFYESPPAPGIFINAPYSATFNCAAGRCGAAFTVNVPAGRFFAGSQELADAAAVTYANAQGAAYVAGCGYPSEVFDQDYPCPIDEIGDTVHIHFDAGAFCGPTQAAANALAQAAADAQAAIELVCEPPPPGPPVMRLTMRSLTSYTSLFEPTRLNSLGTAWAGHTLPPSGTPPYHYYNFKIHDTDHYPSIAWTHYVGGDPRDSTAWIEVFSGFPAEPLESQFPEKVQWSFRAGASPTAPPAGTGPLEIDVSPTPHMVGVGQWNVSYNDHRSFTLRIENIGEDILTFGTPTLAAPVGETSWSHWSMDQSAIPDLAPGAHFDIVVTGYLTNPGGSQHPVDGLATLTIPNNLPSFGGPNAYVDFAVRLDTDD